jgi:hypothetical protein
MLGGGPDRPTPQVTCRASELRAASVQSPRAGAVSLAPRDAGLWIISQIGPPPAPRARHPDPGSLHGLRALPPAEIDDSDIRQ